MVPENVQIDGLLAAALGPEKVAWPFPCDPGTVETVLKLIDYHGIAGLLFKRLGSLESWPQDLRLAVGERAKTHAMWELRHRHELTTFLELLADGAIPALLLKGSALAYDLYDNPAHRVRGDTDVLIRNEDVRAVRRLLTDLSFERLAEGTELPDELRAQESWIHIAQDGSRHVIDLHWRVLNAPALHALFPFARVWNGRRPLPQLSAAAFAPHRSILLAHACVHRAFHKCSPYFVGGHTYFGGDRLIWLWDIALLSRSLSETDWDEFTQVAIETGLGPSIEEGLASAQSYFDFPLPARVGAEVKQAGSNSYLNSGQFGRAVRDWWAVQGPRSKAEYTFRRLLPTGQFMRAKYAGAAERPLPLLYLRRMGEFIRARPTRSQSR